MKIPKIAIGEMVYPVLFYDGDEVFEIVSETRMKIRAKLKDVILSYNRVVVLVEGKVKASFKSLSEAIEYFNELKDACNYFKKYLDICIGFI